MTNRRSKEKRQIDKLVELENNARARYVYFVAGNPDDGYCWSLVDFDNRTLCSGAVFASKSDCLRSLRLTQRHASTTQIRDDAR